MNILNWISQGNIKIYTRNITYITWSLFTMMVNICDGVRALGYIDGFEIIALSKWFHVLKNNYFGGHRLSWEINFLMQSMNTATEVFYLLRLLEGQYRYVWYPNQYSIQFYARFYRENIKQVSLNSLMPKGFPLFSIHFLYWNSEL